MLAVLMGGGLVLFGIGGDVSGGLVRRLQRRRRRRTATARSRSGSSARRSGSQANPQNTAALKELVRDNYRLAPSQQPSRRDRSSRTTPRTTCARPAVYWQRYVAATERRARPGARHGGAAGLRRGGAQPAEGGAGGRGASSPRTPNDSQTYLQLVQYAALAGDTRTADLAAQKAVDLAPKDSARQSRSRPSSCKTPAARQPASDAGDTAGRLHGDRHEPGEA